MPHFFHIFTHSRLCLCEPSNAFPTTKVWRALCSIKHTLCCKLSSLLSTRCSQVLKNIMSGVYPTRAQFALNFATLLTRGPLLCAIGTHALYPLYRRLIAALNWSDAAVFTAILGGTHTLTYLIVNGFFGLCDYKGWLSKYKLPRKPAQQPSKSLILATLRQAAVGQILSPLLVYYLLRNVFKAPSQSAPLPSILKTWMHFALATLTNEVLFYSAHRILHEFPTLYRLVHKQHHQYVGSMSIAAEYSALPEELFGAVVPTVSYMLSVGAPVPIFGVWIFHRLFETYESHSGFCFRSTWVARWLGLLNSERTEFHDYHHTANTGNFGTNVCMDYLLGTMTPYLQSKQRQHIEQ